MAVSVVIPAYNEEKRLPAALESIADAGFADLEVVVVDDGSCDRTSEVAASRGAKVVRLPRNGGKGAAVKTGVFAASGDAVVVMDADLSVPVEFVRPMLSLLERADVVIGSRRHPESLIARPQPFGRRLAGAAFSAAVRILTGLPFADTQCGFKGFTRAAARAVFERVRCSGFAFDVEALLVARELGLRVVEMPVVWRDGPRSSVSLRKGMRAFAELWALSRRFRGSGAADADGFLEERGVSVLGLDDRIGV